VILHRRDVPLTDSLVCGAISRSRTMTVPLRVRFPLVPTGKVKWYDADKGFGFLTRDDGGEVFVHSTALEAVGSALRAGQRVEFGVAEGRRGTQALQVRVLEPPPTVAKSARKDPEEMVLLIEDLIKLLDGVSNTYRRSKHPDSRDAKKIGAVLRAVAGDIEA
jgi:CspA family cold shock protein